MYEFILWSVWEGEVVKVLFIYDFWCSVSIILVIHSMTEKLKWSSINLPFVGTVYHHYSHYPLFAKTINYLQFSIHRLVMPSNIYALYPPKPPSINLQPPWNHVPLPQPSRQSFTLNSCCHTISKNCHFLYSL